MSRRSDIVIIIPTYNNSSTLRGVIKGCRTYSFDIIVVNDGSTDDTLAVLKDFPNIYIINFQRNRGKGAALLEGMRYAAHEGYNHAITIDSDGQHITQEIQILVDAAINEPDVLWVGSRRLISGEIPAKNSFANKFSNFWFRIQTGIKMEDTQSGFRCYPLEQLKGMKFISGRYEFELEILIRYAWKYGKVKNIPVKVIYPRESERVSHFRPVRDFMRISLLNTVFTLIALLLYWPCRFFKWFSRENIKNFIRNNITHSSESNFKIASAIGMGLFFGIVPIWGYQMVASIVTAHFLKLNKVLVLVFANISIPPMIPFILYGSFATGAFVLGIPLDLIPDHLTLSIIGGWLKMYIIGAVIFAIIVGLAGLLISFLLLSLIRRKRV